MYEIERLKSLLQAERSKNELMGETISSLKQDKELLQQELTKKAELICDFLQDQLRPGDNIPFKPIIFHFWIIPSFYDMKGSMEIRRPCFLWLVDKRRTLSSSQMEAGSSHQIITSIPEEGAAFDSPALFDSFEEVELHPLDRQRTIKISSKRSRDGENTRVRSK